MYIGLDEIAVFCPACLSLHENQLLYQPNYHTKTSSLKTHLLTSSLTGVVAKHWDGKYVEVYISVLILWKTHKGAHSNHIRQKKFKKTLQKWWKLSNFHNIWNIKAYFGKTFSLKYIKVYMIRKTILSAFHCFLFHKNIPNTFEVIALLLKTNIIFGNFLVNFCSV